MTLVIKYIFFINIKIWFLIFCIGLTLQNPNHGCLKEPRQKLVQLNVHPSQILILHTGKLEHFFVFKRLPLVQMPLLQHYCPHRLTQPNKLTYPWNLFPSRTRWFGIQISSIIIDNKTGFF